MWFSNCDRHYYCRIIYSTMSIYCKESCVFWNSRNATVVPDEAYIHDTIELQAHIFDKEGNSILKSILTEACDRL